MSVTPPIPRRPPLERLEAWVVTGPLGHLYSVVADVSEFAARLLAQRIVRGAGRRFSARR